MVCFQTQNPNLGKFWRALDWKNGYILYSFGIFYGHLEYFMDIWNIVRTFGIFYDHLVHFVFIWYIFSGFGIMDQEKSGNPDLDGILIFLFNPVCIEKVTRTLS
jgi:hypothetical protein